MRSKTLLGNAGQSMILTMMIGAMLVIGVSATVLVNQVGTAHQNGSSQRTKARAIAQEGITIAMQQLSADAATWARALNGDFSNTACVSPTPVSDPSGARFRIDCSTGASGNPNLQPYQVAIVAVGLATGSDAPLRAIKAYVSARTLGVDLTTDLHAAVALDLVRQPVADGTLNVQWGPISCRDAVTTAAWVLKDPIDSSRAPRKFSAGGITGAAPYPRSGSTAGAGPDSDHTEYWSYAPRTFPPIVDEDAYTVAAEKEQNIPAPSVGGTLWAASNCLPAGNLTCGYFDPQGGVAVFDGASPGYQVPSGSVLWINGDAEFNRVALDGVTVIVTGNLTVTNAQEGLLDTQVNLHVPATAAQDYPFDGPPTSTTPPSWPCNGKAGHLLSNGQPAYDCGAASVFSGNVQFRGFLNVKGNLKIAPTTAAQTVNMVGAFLVGDTQAAPGTSGRLMIASGAQWNIAYDDLVNHAILMKPVLGSAIKVVVDSVSDVPVY